MPESDARTVAEVLATADSWGVFTHGTKLLCDYVHRILAGSINLTQPPEIERDGPGWALVDAHSAIGQVGATFAMHTAIEKAQRCGIAYVTVKNTNHFGAAGYYAWLAARQQCIGISVANDVPSVAAPGSRKAVLGSNPFAFGIPTGRESDPILLDIATSTVAGGKVYAARERGEPLPLDWIVGPDGLPTTDGSLYPLNASLQPMAGHKGYGISLLIETLAGVMSGAGMTWQVGNWMFGDRSKPTGHGAAFIAIDVTQIMPESEYAARIHHVMDEIRATPTVDGVARVMLPGDREWAVLKTTPQNGIRLPPDVVAKHTELAKLIGVQAPWIDPQDQIEP